MCKGCERREKAVLPALPEGLPDPGQRVQRAAAGEDHRPPGRTGTGAAKNLAFRSLRRPGRAREDAGGLREGASTLGGCRVPGGSDRAVQRACDRRAGRYAMPAGAYAKTRGQVVPVPDCGWSSGARVGVHRDARGGDNSRAGDSGCFVN